MLEALQHRAAVRLSVGALLLSSPAAPAAANTQRVQADGQPPVEVVEACGEVIADTLGIRTLADCKDDKLADEVDGIINGEALVGRQSEILRNPANAGHADKAIKNLRDDLRDQFVQSHTEAAANQPGRSYGKYTPLGLVLLGVSVAFAYGAIYWATRTPRQKP